MTRFVHAGLAFMVIAFASMASCTIDKDDSLLPGKQCPCAVDEGYGCNSAGTCERCATGLSVCNGKCTDTSADPTNCGVCGDVCTSANGSAGCAAGKCIVAACQVQWGNCDGLADNGCETHVTTDTQCGGCNSDCTQQGMQCGIDARCECGNSSCGAGMCVTTTRTCRCNAGSDECAAGETCSGSPAACSCNGGAACPAGDACCSTIGCVDIRTDAQNCGTCGHACPPNFICNHGPPLPDGGMQGGCTCSTATDCDNGSGLDNVQCNSDGLCVCGSTVCPQSRRCSANGGCI